MLQQWITKYNDKNNSSNLQTIEESPKATTSTTNTGATSLPPIGDSFMFVEKSGTNIGQKFSGSFERTDFIQISNVCSFITAFQQEIPKRRVDIGIQLLIN